MRHVVHFSGGLCSFWAASRVLEKHGKDNVTLLFADTLMEDVLANSLLRPFQNRSKFNARTRAKIIRVGHIIKDENGAHPSGFVFLCTNETPMISYGPDRQILLGNYTTEELIEIASRREEFE